MCCLSVFSDKISGIPRKTETICANVRSIFRKIYHNINVGDRTSLGCLVGVSEKALKTKGFLLSVAADQRRDKNNINVNYKLSTLLQIKSSLKMCKKNNFSLLLL